MINVITIFPLHAVLNKTILLFPLLCFSKSNWKWTVSIDVTIVIVLLIC